MLIVSVNPTPCNFAFFLAIGLTPGDGFVGLEFGLFALCELDDTRSGDRGLSWLPTILADVFGRLRLVDFAVFARLELLFPP